MQVSVVDLLLDDENPRLLNEGGATQQDIAVLLVQRVGADVLLRLAKDILGNGIDPLMLTAVMPTADQRGRRYRVLEGNRRLLALMALDAPSLVSPVMTAGQMKRLSSYNAEYAQDPIDTVNCVLFEKRRDADHWIGLRHTGFNNGVGLMGWGTKEQDIFNERVKGKRSPAGQILDFVEAAGMLSLAAKASDRRVTTTGGRMAGTPHWRDKAGIGLVRGEIVALYPEREVAKSLTKLVEDLLTGKINVSGLHSVQEREAYADTLKPKDRPKASTALDEPVLLADLTLGVKNPRKASIKNNKRGNTKRRTAIIPSDDRLEIDPKRINDIYTELASLNAERYTNASSVLLRVFVELSVDHVIEDKDLMTEENMRNQPLAKRMKVVVRHLHNEGTVSAKLKKAIEGIADGSGVLVPGVPTFNQYVHNQYSLPKPSELQRSWDELAPFMAKIWK